MKKEEFLKKLEKRLSILNEEERQDILDEYRNHMEKKMNSGMTEEEAVKDFGDFDTLVKDILSAYKINENYTKDGKKIEGAFNVIADEMVHFFQRLMHSISNKKGEDLLRIICKIILILFIIWLMRIPVWIIRGLGESIFSAFPGVLDHILSVSWAVLIEIFYIIISILMLYTLIKKMIFENDDQKLVEDKIKIENIEEKRDDEKKEDKKIPSNEKTTPTNGIVNLLMIIVKIFVVIFTLPLLCGWLGLIITFGIMIALCMRGIFLISLFLIIGGLILITTGLLGIIYRTVWKESK